MTSGGRRVRANLLLLLCAAIWGFAFVAQAVGAHIGAFTFTATRFAMGALVLLPLIAWFDRRRGAGRADGVRRWRTVVVPGLVCGALLFGGSALQQLGIEGTTAGNAAFVTGLYVVAVPVVSVLFGRRPHLAIWVGAVLALVGLYLLTVTADARVNPGDPTVLAGTAFWTAHILALAHYSPRVDALRLSVAQFAATAVYATVAALALDPAPFRGVPDALGALLYAGVVSVGIAFTLQVVAQADAIPSHASMIMSLESMFGALGGALLLGEQMSSRALVGAALMMAGILVAQLPARGERALRRGGGPASGIVPVPEPPSTAFREG